MSKIISSLSHVEFTLAWRALISKGVKNVRLAEAALCAAVSEYPQLNVSEYLARLDTMSKELQQRVTPAMSIAEKIDLLQNYMFDELGYAGNSVEYSDPRNSYLNEVIDRKLGLPITLAIIYLDLAAALQLPSYGIGFPGHFLVGLKSADRRWYIDVFNQGRQLSRDDLNVMLAGEHHEKSVPLQSLEINLKPVDNIAILVRMLRNLKTIYIERTEVARALHIIAMIQSILPDAPDEIRDRGMIYQHIDYTNGAIEDLSRYLQLAPDAQERALVESLLESLQNRPTRLH